MCMAAQRCWRQDVACIMNDLHPASWQNQVCSAQAGQKTSSRVSVSFSAQHLLLAQNLCTAAGCEGVCWSNWQHCSAGEQHHKPSVQLASSKHETGLSQSPLSSRTTFVMIKQQRHTKSTSCSRQHGTVGLLVNGKAPLV